MGGDGGGAVVDVNSKRELDEVLRGGGAVVLHFWTSWCEASKQMDQVFSHLSTNFPHARFFRGGRVVDTLEGANPPSLACKVTKVAASDNHSESAAPASLGMAAGPTILESFKELASQNGASVV